MPSSSEPGASRRRGPSASGQQQAVVAEAPIALEQQLLQAGVEPDDPGRGPELDLVLAVELARMDVGLLGALAAQVVLRQRRALVRALRLRRRSGSGGRRSPPRAGSGRPWRRPGRLRRSRTSDLWACVPPRNRLGASLRRAERRSYAAVRTRPARTPTGHGRQARQRPSFSPAAPASAPFRPGCCERSMSARSLPT